MRRFTGSTLSKRISLITKMNLRNFIRHGGHRSFSAKTQFRCEECGTIHLKWNGKCSECNVWNTIVEESAPMKKNTSAKFGNGGGSMFDISAVSQNRKPVSMSKIKMLQVPRMPVASEEFNRILGGGIVHGSVTLIGGAPGVGKSTLMLQVASWVANAVRNSQHENVLYVSGEESESQIKMRAERLGVDKFDNLHVLSENHLESINWHLTQQDDNKYAAAVIDSIQTMRSDQSNSAAGSVVQVRHCTSILTQVAKASGIPVFIVGHVTKEGDLAGPSVLEHLVDCVLFLEGENGSSNRLMRCFKNRFGSASEVGAFEMLSTGMIDLDSSTAFLSRSSDSNDPEIDYIPGSAIAIAQLGSRALPVEIQALVSPAAPQLPPRYRSLNVSKDRFHVLLAVLSQRAKVKTFNHDIYVNAVGGAKVDEPASDLSMAVAIASAVNNTPVNKSYCFVGEIGLGGEIYPAGQLEQRIKSAESLGFSHLYARISEKEEKNLAKLLNSTKVQVVPVKTLRHCLSMVF